MLKKIIYFKREGELSVKKAFILSIVLLFIFFTACSNSADSLNGEADGSETGADTEEIELTFTTWGNEKHIEMYEKVLEEFHDEHPNITVKIQSIPHADYQQKISVLAAGQELPDVGWVAERMVPQFVQNGILRDVSVLKDDQDFEFDDFIPSTLELWEHDGALLGLPFSTPPMIFYYNKTLFEEAGIETPNEFVQKGEWTWEKFEEVSRELSKGEGSDRVYGARLFYEWTNFALMLSHTWAHGGDLFNDDMTEFTWDSPQGRNTLEMLDRMMFEDRSHVPPQEEINFESGKVGMFPFMYSYIANLRDITDFEWDIAPLPKGPEGRMPLLGQAGIVAFEDSQHPEEALELLKFLTSKKGIQASSTYFVPPRRSVLESDEFINVPNNPPRESIEMALINEMDKARVYPQHKDWTKIESEIISGFDQLFSQIAEPADILKEMKQNIDPILEQATN